MRIVTFYTPEYAGEVQPWVDSIMGSGLPYFIDIKDSLGSWRKNVGMKPQFLLDCLEQFKEPILWIDMDGRVVGPMHDLGLAPGMYDFGAWFIPWDQMNPADRPGGAKTKNDGISSGTMFWNYTPAAIAFLNRWIYAENGQYKYGQIVLGDVWHGMRPPELRTWRMPQAWFKVFDRPWKRGESGPAIIEHFQASRRLRNKIK
jgi:hypothetical protein